MSDGQRNPIFIIGFPRSGTTLLDTILSGHPSIEIIEEKSMVSQLIGSLNELTKNNFSQNILKEFLIGILNGVIFAIISAFIVQMWFEDIQLSIIISISMVLNMIVAGLFGILVPITLKKFNIDPAIASSVFVTTITDVIGFLSFLGIGAYFFYT